MDVMRRALGGCRRLGMGEGRCMGRGDLAGGRGPGIRSETGAGTGTVTRAVVGLTSHKRGLRRGWGRCAPRANG